jgi:hypothetical protein
MEVVGIVGVWKGGGDAFVQERVVRNGVVQAKAASVPLYV